MVTVLYRAFPQDSYSRLRQCLIWLFLCWPYDPVLSRGREPAVPQINVEGYPLTCNDYYMRIMATGTTPADGIYIVNNQGNALNVYCDMTRDGGGWTLLFTSTDPTEFGSRAELEEKSSVSPTLSGPYSILTKADYFKTNATGDKMLYRLEAFEPGRYGGIWEMSLNYTFMSTLPNQPSVLVKKFDEWTPNINSVQDRVPWIYDSVGLYLTTNDIDANGNWWGTIACVMCYPVPPYPNNLDPTPWMNPEMKVPDIIWYWAKEFRPIPESYCYEDVDRFDHWKRVSNDKETFFAMALVRPEDIQLPWETAWKALTIMTTYSSDECLHMGIDDLVLVYRVLKSVTRANFGGATNILGPLIKNYVKIASRLLHKDNFNEWKRGKQAMGPTAVIKAMDEFADSIADVMLPNTTLNAKTDNIEFSIRSVSLGEASETGMRFPPINEYGPSGQDAGWISISANSVQQLLHVHNASTQVAYITILYKNITELLETDVAGGDVYDLENVTVVFGQSVISATLRIERTRVSIPVLYQLPHNVQESYISANNEIVSVCAFIQFVEQTRFDYSKQWSSEGCQVSRSSNINIQCTCNHTTNFAVLMQVVPFEIPDHHSQILRYITYTGCSISIVAMMATLALYNYLKSLLPAERISIHKNLILAITISHIISMATESASQQEITCKIFAVMLHYACTAMFLWMLAEGIHLYRQIVAVYGSERSWMNYYYGMAWGLPFVIVAITAGIRIEDYGAENHCWLSVKSGVIWAFVGPAILIMAANLLVLIMVVRVVVSASANSGHKQNDNVKAGVKSSLLLLPLLGITWCFGLFATGEETIVFLYIFAILNSLQGLFIFLFHVIYNSEVRSALRRKKEKFEAERGQFVTSTIATVSKNGSRYARSFATKSTRVTRMSSEQTLQLEDVISDVKMLEGEDAKEPQRKSSNTAQPASMPVSRKSLTVYPSEPAMGLKKSAASKEQLTLNRPHSGREEDPW